MAGPIKDSEAWREQQRFYNFLQYYDLHKYYRRLTGMGVTKVSHLKIVDDETLVQIGMSRPERNRLRKKLEENFSISGKLKKAITGKSSRFDPPALEAAHYKENSSNTHHTATLVAKDELSRYRGHSQVRRPRESPRTGQGIVQGGRRERPQRQRVAGVLHGYRRNQEALDRRGQQLSDINQKTAELADNAVDFAVLSERLSRKYK